MRGFVLVDVQHMLSSVITDPTSDFVGPNGPKTPVLFLNVPRLCAVHWSDLDEAPQVQDDCLPVKKKKKKKLYSKCSM